MKCNLNDDDKFGKVLAHFILRLYLVAPRENSGGSLFLKSRSAEVQFSDLCKINCYYYYYYYYYHYYYY